MIRNWKGGSGGGWWSKSEGGRRCVKDVTTKDGYILSLQRIPMGKSGIKSDKPPVLLQHGIMITCIKLGLHEFIPGGEAVANLVEEICNKTHNNCSNLMVALTGKNCCLNASTTGIFLENEPQSSTTKNLIHLAQMIRQGTLAMYDYGNEDENNIHYYGQPAPPVYNTTSIPNDLPLFLSYGGQNLLSDVNGVQTLLDTLKDHDAYKLVVQCKEN
ncbi:Triacylglycerol lipase 2 [Camellia lanceoleosa]|uniref:Triacylglycerol lipase 2 n=1 Tax=Camellia lanceoleosa TaxID=1840588 RepID=A0ACC0HAA7_9ERIC|nr:Triacylglycerol lipase 2 [Camellia lanceoleosa]